MDRHRAGDRTNGPGPDPKRGQCSGGALAQPRVRGQTEIVVRGEIDHRPVVDRRVRPLLAVEHPQAAIQALVAERRQAPRTGTRAGRRAPADSSLPLFLDVLRHELLEDHLQNRRGGHGEDRADDARAVNRQSAAR